MERRRRARMGRRQSNVRNGTQSNAIQSKRKKGGRRRMERSILFTSYFSTGRSECHAQSVLGWILRLDCLGSSLSSPCGSIHSRPCPCGPTPVGFLLGPSHGPLAMPVPSPGKGRNAGRGPTRKAAVSTLEEKRGKENKKDGKKTENDPNCKRRMGRCSSDVDVRGRTKAKHEW